MKVLFNLFLFSVLFTSFSYGAEVSWNSRLEGSSIFSGQLTVTDGDFNNLTSGNFVDVNTHSYIRLGITERNAMTYTPGNAQGTTDIVVSVNITPYSNAGVAQTMITQSLNIQYSSNGMLGITVDADDYRMIGVHKFKVQIASITINGVVINSSNAQTIPNYLFLEGGYYSERYYKLDEVNTPIVKANYIAFNPTTGEDIYTHYNATILIPTIATTKEIELSWNYIGGAEYYDVEWTWIDNYSTTLGSTRPITDLTLTLTEEEFKNNSTRIRTSLQNYRLPQVFAKGYLVYRVRAVGKWPTDVTKDKYGKWSSGANAKSIVNSWPNVIEIGVEHEKDKNWQYQSTYAEEGKKKEVVQYFDGSLRGRQTVTRINSDNKSVVGETIYDNEGRGVVQVLPVPQINPSIQYYPSLNKNDATTPVPYSHHDFDWELKLNQNCVAASPTGMSTVDGASKYYSPGGNPAGGSGWQQYVPDAEKFPFTQVEYTPDNTGRIRNQSGVGANHKIGSGHETYYYYLQPSQEELNRLFGYNVGYMNRYKKNMVVDANGQVSVSYLDAQGRVIATALTGTNQTPLNALASATSGNHNLASSDLINKIDQLDTDKPADNNKLFSTGRFGATNDGLKVGTQIGVNENGSVYDFVYTVDTKAYTENCPKSSPIAYPYVYDLTLTLKDDCGKEYFTHTYTRIGTEQIGSLAGTFESLSENVTGLKKGSYTLLKEIKVNQQALENYTAHYMDPEMNRCLLGTADFPSVISTDCGTTCAECQAGLGEIDAFLNEKAGVQGSALTQEQVTFYTKIFNQLVKDCNEPCRLLTSCDVYHGMFIADLKPGGQYAGILKADGIADDVLNVFAPGNSLNADWRSVVFKDEAGNDAKVTVSYNAATGTYSPELVPSFTTYNGSLVDVVFETHPTNLLKVSDLAAIFEDSWAEALFPFHPEYRLYQYAMGICDGKYLAPGSTMALSSDEYDGILRDNILTMVQADNTGSNAYNIDFIPSGGNAIYATDPYFSTTYAVHNLGTLPVLGAVDNTALKNALMLEAINTNYKGTGYTMLAYAARTVLCGNNYTTSCTVTNAYSWSDVAGISDAATKNLIWSTYKSYYLSYKGTINQLLMDMHAFKASPGIYNGCIGSGGLQYGLLSSMSTSGQYNTIRGRIFALWNLASLSFVNFPTAVCDPMYDIKISRFPRIDVLYNSALPASVVIEQGSAAADYAAWQQTGICPDLKDMERFLDALGRTKRFKSSVSMIDINEFVPDLFKTISGNLPVAGDNMVIAGTPSGTNLNMTFTKNGVLQCTITFPQIGSLSWADYNNGLANEWQIYSVSNSYPGTGNTVSILVKAGLSLATAQEYVVNFTSCTNLNTCQAQYTASNAQDPNCDKEEKFETALLALMQKLKANGTFFNSNVSLAGLTEYTASDLFLHMGGVSAVWNGPDAGNGYTISLVSSAYTFSLPLTGFPTSAQLTAITSLDLVGNTIYVQAYTTTGFVNTQGVYSYRLGGLRHRPLNLNCICATDALTNLFNYMVAQTSIPNGATPPEFIAAQPFTSGTAIYQFVKTATGFKSFFIETLPNVKYSCSVTLTGNTTAYDILYITDLVVAANLYSYTCIGHLSNGTTIALSGDGCFIKSKPCNPCKPEAIAPLSCNTAFSTYSTFFNTRFRPVPAAELAVYNAEYVISETDFCNQSFAYIATAYQNYITNSTLGITTVLSDRFLTLAQFGATPLGYSNEKLSAAVTAYVAYVSINQTLPMSWNDYVATIYMPANPSICPAMSPPAFQTPPPLDPMPCDQWENNVSIVNAFNQYNIYKSQMKAAFTQSYIEGAISSLVETFRESHQDKEYHYTLYYYDRAGNLIQTVPPNGVARFDYTSAGTPIPVGPISPATHTVINNLRVANADNPVAAPGTAIKPAHTFETTYHYNSLNQLVQQKTPDGGESRFAYDDLGRLVISQNAKQKTVLSGRSSYSYIRYDELGRVAEAGELELPSPAYAINDEGKLTSGGVAVADVDNVIRNIAVAAYKKEVTHSIYDELGTMQVTVSGSSILIKNLFGSDYSMLNTRKRIVGVIYQETYNANLNVYQNGTFYDYDAHGNVKHLIQINNDANLMALNQHVKHFHYEYDLVSGNVNKVIYQKQAKDQYMHRYQYDSDNRVTQVETSKDGVYYEKDAKYFYYNHGSLARTEIGNKKVQAEDYAYTIQGWIKTVNGEELSAERMMGKDGKITTLNANVARDAYGYSLGYFNGDYASANQEMLNYSRSSNAGTQATLNSQQGNSLYNGNIRSMHTAMSNLAENIGPSPILTHRTRYGYDQLNRITSMDGENMNFANPSTISSSPSGYNSTYSYDPNGNLKTMKNSGKVGALTKAMDDFVYNYDAGTNRLNYVMDDMFLSGNYTEDIDNQPVNNYGYDNIGQLIKDTDSKIQTIKWTVSNKVKEVIYNGTLAGKKIVFDYDAMGHRIAKHHTATNGDLTSTFYVLDAKGNPMSTYERKKDVNSVYKLYLAERNIYGSERIGTEEVNEEMTLAKLDTYFPLSPVNTIAIGQMCTTTGQWFYQIPSTLSAVSDVNADGYEDVTFSNANNAAPYMSAQIGAYVIPGAAYTLDYDLLAKVNVSDAFCEVKDCSSGIVYVTSSSTTLGHKTLSFIVPAGGSNRVIIRWWGSKINTVNTTFTLSKIKFDGPGTPFDITLPPAKNKIGDKRFELANHLGNVLNVITDRKLPIKENILITNSFNTSDYTPFSASGTTVLSVVSNRLQVSNAGLYQGAYTNLPTTPGQVYRVKFAADLIGLGNLSIYAYDDPSSSFISHQPITATGNHYMDFLAVSTTTRIVVESAVTGPRTFYLDDISIELGVATYANTFNDGNILPFTGPATPTESLGRLKTPSLGLSQNVNMPLYNTVAGKVYRVTFHVDLDGGGNINAFAQDMNTLSNLNTLLVTSSGNRYFEFTATGSSTRIGFENLVTGPRIFYLDHFSIQARDLESVITYYTADVVSYSDYYPFGMQMPGRKGNTSEYRYGYQGSEKDDEVKGEGNSYTTEFRQLDPRLGRWLSIDPKSNAWESPYTSMSNNPLLFNDPLGDKVKGNKRLINRYKASIQTKLADAAVAMRNELNADVPDETRITAISEIQDKLNQQMEVISQIEDSKMVYRIKRGNKYPMATSYRINSSDSPDSEFGFDQRDRAGILMIHPDATNFELSMSYVVTAAALFDQGESSLAANLTGGEIAWGLGGLLFDDGDLSKQLDLMSVWNIDVKSPTLSDDMSRASDMNSKIVTENRKPGRRALFETVPVRRESEDGDKGSNAAMAGKSTYSGLFRSPGFANMKNTTVYYDSSENAVNLPAREIGE